MTSVAWLSISCTEAGCSLHEWADSFQSLGLSDSHTPIFTTFVGKHRKAELLTALQQESTSRAHQGVYLQRAGYHDACSPVIHVDCEIRRTLGGSRSLSGSSSRPINWLNVSPKGRIQAQQALHISLTARVLGAVSDTVCYFVTDVGGTNKLAEQLVGAVMLHPATDLPREALPAVLIVQDTASDSFDCHLAEARVMDRMKEMMLHRHSMQGSVAIAKIMSHFRQVQVIGIRRQDLLQDQVKTLKRRLISLRQDFVLARSNLCLRFSAIHTYAFVQSALTSFCDASDNTISYAQISRPAGFSLAELEVHLTELLCILPSEIWVFHLFCPLFAATFLAVNYPPESHEFDAIWLYDRLYQVLASRVIDEAFVQSDTRKSVKVALREELKVQFKELKEKHASNASLCCKERMGSLKLYLGNLRTYKTCLACLLKAPEKVLTCGHAICDTCIRRAGRRVNDERHSFVLEQCPLCFVHHSGEAFRFLAPTAGVRVLDIDGGGIKDIIPLVVLQNVENELRSFAGPLCNHFDFVCGTSAGGLIVLGIFLMRWSIAQCIEKFETLATETFRPVARRNSRFQRLQETAVAYLRDWQYTAIAVETAFRTTFGSNIDMFNPLSNDTKVAVTTTTTSGSQPCIFSNYNGPSQDKTSGYVNIRANKPKDEVTISDAAKCTAAAPKFFNTVRLQNIGTFQDGGLHHNNPVWLAKREVNRLWPEKHLPDFALSIGTGFVPSSFRLTNTTAKSRFFMRIFDSLMQSIDGERIWVEFKNALPNHERRRYHRINLPLDGKEPALDDISAMIELKARTQSYLKSNPHLTQDLTDRMIASAFYFELDKKPRRSGKMFSCVGHIYCRLPLPEAARRSFARRLLTTSAYFTVRGQTVSCIDRLTKSAPNYKRRIMFMVPDLESTISIKIHCLVREPQDISGMPISMQKVIEAQSLNTCFGRLDHVKLEKELPMIPFKRKFSDTV